MLLASVPSEILKKLFLPGLEVRFLPRQRKAPRKKKIIAISLRPTPHPITSWESWWGPRGPGYTV